MNTSQIQMQINAPPNSHFESSLRFLNVRKYDLFSASFTRFSLGKKNTHNSEKKKVHIKAAFQSSRNDLCTSLRSTFNLLNENFGRPIKPRSKILVRTLRCKKGPECKWSITFCHVRASLSHDFHIRHVCDSDKKMQGKLTVFCSAAVLVERFPNISVVEAVNDKVFLNILCIFGFLFRLYIHWKLVYELYVCTVHVSVSHALVKIVWITPTQKNVYQRNCGFDKLINCPFWHVHVRGLFIFKAEHKQENSRRLIWISTIRLVI